MRPALHFDLASPYTYLAAERAERLFPGVRWLPAFSEQLSIGDPVDDRRRHLIAQRAALLGLPIVWPMGPPLRVVGDVSRDAAIEEAGRKLVAAAPTGCPC